MNNFNHGVLRIEPNNNSVQKCASRILNLHLDKKRTREPGRDVKILRDRMLRIKGSAEHSRCCCCCCFSHSTHWLPARKKLLYTVANPARGLLNKEKKKKKVWQRSPPPPLKIKIKIKITRRIHMSRRYVSRRHAGGIGPSRVRTRIPTTRRLGQWLSLLKILRFRVRLQLSKSRCLSSPDDVWPRLPLLPSTRP